MEFHRVLGLMSGTSLDGLDLAFCQFRKVDDAWTFKILDCETISYTQEWTSRLRNAVQLSAEEIEQLHVDYGELIAHIAVGFLKRTPMSPELVASHGHTIFHQPGKRFTTQIGHGQEMANIIRIPVVCDFRSNDVLLGGQGAPLVPIGDELLFNEYEACLNLGGFSNISFQQDGKRRAFDIGPANMLLNFLAQKRDLEYDKDSLVAKTGLLNDDLLQQLNNLPYYQKPLPKTLGFEWFAASILPILDEQTIPLQDQLRTAVEHIAWTIGTSIQHYRALETGRILVTGGGVHNPLLVERLTYHLPEGIHLEIPETEIIDYKEAMVFAFLGLLRKEGKINCLASVTGASRDSSSGVSYFPA